MVLHQLVYSSPRCIGYSFRVALGIRLAFCRVKTGHESSPIWLDHLSRAKVEQLLHKREHA